MVFVKGHKLSVESREKMRQAKLGSIPWNKGTKGLMKPNKTSFKKGQRPQNYQGGLSFFTRDNRWVIFCRDRSLMHYARAVMECVLSRKLESSEIVHHINEDSTDDRPENLEVVTRSVHINIHRKKLEKARGIC